MSQPLTIQEAIEGNIPEGWFLWKLSNRKTRIVYAGDQHLPLANGLHWECSLQFIDGGGRIITKFAPTCDEAIRLACDEAWLYNAKK